MKNWKRLIALILCLGMLLSLFGCTGDPVENTAPTEPPTEAPTEPPATDIYAQAREALAARTDISLAVVITTYTTVDGDEFSQRSTQTLTYRGIGTDAPQVLMDETIEFSVHSEDTEELTEEEKEDSKLTYREIYDQGTVYAALTDIYHFSGAVEQETLAARYTPVVLLDAALYGSLTSEKSGSSTKILFSEPTAAEGWAMPEGAEMKEASGSALVSEDGDMEQMDYTVTYTYGPAEIRLEVQSKPLAETAEITVPADPTAYPTLQNIDVLKIPMVSSCLLAQADSISTSSLESLFCQAAGVMRNQSCSANLHGRRENTLAKVESNVFFKDYGSGEDQEYEQEEVYIDGKYTITVNDGLPTSQSNITWEQIREYCSQTMMAAMVGTIGSDFWADAVITDMGSVYLIEYTLNENFGNSIQNGICKMLWDDPSFLMNLSSGYVNNETSGYLSVDKYTGLPVACGYYYEGTHTIQGGEYALTLQYDQSVEGPAKGAYQEITDKMPEEAEPETKATPLFYHVTGENGQEMWLFGTIHVGDERTAYLPAEIRAAFEASDALAVECDTEAFDDLVEEDEKLQEQVSNLYYFSNGTTMESLMEEEDYAQAVRLMKATGNYNMNMPYAKPYVWSSSIENFYLRQGYSLHGDQGVEERLMDWAEELDKEILEVESSLFQIKMLTGYSNDLQLLMLEESMESSAEDYWEGVNDLYEKWCAGDEAVLREELSDELDLSELTEEELAEYEAQKHLIEEYDKAMSYDRNDGMLKKAKEYLESGKTVFFAVGLAHLLNDVNGLVDTLQEAGYTVELVTYQ